MGEELTCGVRNVTAPDGTEIPVPVGGLGLEGGELVTTRNDAQVQISEPDDASRYYAFTFLSFLFIS
jgi:hypothetical protein